MTEPHVLVVGSRSSWQTRRGRPEPLPGFHFCEYDDLALFMARAPVVDIVLSPLMALTFDAMDVAVQLAGCGFAGRYRALVDDLPNPRLVQREVRLVAPGIDFDVVRVADMVTLHRPSGPPTPVLPH